MKTNITSYFIIILLLPVYAWADGGLTLFPKGARSEGMGNTGLVLKDVWAAYNNQAALASVHITSIGFHYENQFNISELSTSAAAIAIPALTGTLGATVAHMGTADYGENRFGVAYAKQLFKKLSLGVQINYHLLTFSSGYPNLYALTAEIAILAEPLDNLSIGAHLFNPNNTNLSNKAEDPIPIIFNVGIGYTFNDNLLLAAEVQQEQHQTMSSKLGLEYFLVDKFCFRIGTLLNPSSVFCGLGWKTNKLAFDFALKRHHTLGYTPALSLSYVFN